MSEQQLDEQFARIIRDGSDDDRTLLIKLIFIEIARQRSIS